MTNITKITDARAYYKKNYKLPKGWVYHGGMENELSERNAMDVVKDVKRNGYKAFYITTWRGSPTYGRYCLVVRTRKRIIKR